jgi:hypothetical protein
MAYQSPFLRLDELKRARDKDTYDTMVETSRQFGQAPLVLDKVLKENQDREAKSEQLKVANKQKADLLAETNRHNTALEDPAKIRADAAAKNADRLGVKQDYTITKDKMQAIVPGKLMEIISQSPDASDDEIVARASAHPELQGVDPQTIRNEVYKTRVKMAKDEGAANTTKEKLRMEQERIDLIKRRLSGTKTPRPKAPMQVDANTGRMLADLGASADQLHSLADKISTSDPGLFSELTQRFGTIVGIQDDQVRMQYLGEINKLLKERSGAQVTPEEYKRLLQEFPDWRAGRDVLYDTLERYAAEKENKYNSIVNTFGSIGRDVSQLPKRGKQPVKQAPPKDPSEKRSDYAKRLLKSGFTEDEIMKIVMGG